MVIRLAKSSVIVTSIGAQAIGVLGQLLFGLSVLYSPSQTQAEVTLGIVIYASVLATCARLGIDNFFISKYRNKTKSSSSIALIYLSFISLVLAIIMFACACIAMSIISKNWYDVNILWLGIFMSLNTLSSNYLALRKKPQIAILLRGNTVFIPGAILTFIGMDSNFIIFICSLVILFSFVTIIKYFNIFSELPRFSILKRNFKRWSKLYFSQGRNGIVYGVLSAVWANWLYFLATFGGLNVNDAIANLMQRILNGCKTLAFMFFLVDPFYLDKRLLDMVLAFYAVLTVLLISSGIIDLNGYTISVILGFLLGLFEFGRVSIMEQKRYIILSLQLLILMIQTIFLSDTMSNLVIVMSVGVIMSLLFEKMIIKMKYENSK